MPKYCKLRIAFSVCGGQYHILFLPFPDVYSMKDQIISESYFCMTASSGGPAAFVLVV